MRITPARIYTTASLTLLTVYSLMGQQPEGESPYSSSTIDTHDGPNLVEDNIFLIILVVVFLAIFIYLFAKGRRRA
jgi:hypothetical protein